MFTTFFILSTILLLSAADDLNCNKHGDVHKNVQLAPYYAETNEIVESEEEESAEVDTDSYRKSLGTLQDWFDGRSSWVTLAMDADLSLPYGTRVCCPELNKYFGRRVPLEVRDHKNHLRRSGFRRADVAVRSEADSYDKFVNQRVTFVIESNV